MCILDWIITKKGAIIMNNFFQGSSVQLLSGIWECSNSVADFFFFVETKWHRLAIALSFLSTKQLYFCLTKLPLSLWLISIVVWKISSNPLNFMAAIFMTTFCYNPKSLICFSLKHLTNDPNRVFFPPLYKLYKVFHAVRCSGMEDRYQLF